MRAADDRVVPGRGVDDAEDPARAGVDRPLLLAMVQITDSAMPSA